VSAASGLNAFMWCWLARPKCDRTVFKLIRKHKPRKLLLLGLSDSVRPLRMISLAKRYRPEDSIDFAGLDRFDSRPAGTPGLSLKRAHQVLRPTGARINLLPGEPYEALMRAANMLHGIEFVVISASQNTDSLSRSWFFLNRLLSPQAIVLREEVAAEQQLIKPISRAELDRLAASAIPHRRAA